MRRPLASLLVAEAISITGSRISAVAVPWLVLTTTGSAVQVGTVAFAQTLPFVLAGLFGGPLVDRIGPRRTAITADAAGAAAVALVPLLYAAGLLSFGVLCAAGALAGTMAGCADTAKRALLPRVIQASGTPMTRGTALADGVGRAATLLGLPLGGVLIAALGPVTVLIIDATSFAVGAAVLAAGVRAREARAAGGQPREPYVAALRTGFGYFRQERLIIAIVGLLFVTNLVDQAYLVVFVPVWVRDAGAAPAVLGLVGGAFGLGAVAGNVVYTALAARLPRHATFAISLLLGGSPRLFALAVTDSVAPVLAVAFGTGVAFAAVNPILSAVGYEWIPPHLQGRVLGAAAALSWGGIPLGGLLGGVAVDLLDLRSALLLGRGALPGGHADAVRAAAVAPARPATPGGSRAGSTVIFAGADATFRRRLTSWMWGPLGRHSRAAGSQVGAPADLTSGRPPLPPGPGRFAGQSGDPREQHRDPVLAVPDLQVCATPVVAGHRTSAQG